MALSISGIKCRCLVDSGSCRSLLRLDKFKELCDKTHRSVFLRPAIELQGIAGGKLSVLGETEVVLDNPSCVVTVTIVSQMRYAMLLGDPEIRQGRGVLDYGHGTFLWNQTQLPLEMGPGDPETIHAVGLKGSVHRTLTSPSSIGSSPSRPPRHRKSPTMKHCHPPQPHSPPSTTTTKHHRSPPSGQSRLDHITHEQTRSTTRWDHSLPHHTPPPQHAITTTPPHHDLYERVDSFGEALPIIDHEDISDTVYDNQDIFSASGETNGRCNVVKFRINTTGSPIALRAYRVPLHKKRLIDDCVDDMLMDGVICPSCSA